MEEAWIIVSNGNMGSVGKYGLTSVVLGLEDVGDLKVESQNGLVHEQAVGRGQFTKSPTSAVTVSGTNLRPAAPPTTTCG